MTSAEKFRYFRDAHRLTQKQLALALGISVRAVKYIENGERDPRTTTRLKFEELVERHKIHSQAGGCTAEGPSLASS